MIIQKDFPLSGILWYKFGPVTKYLLTCEKPADIIEAIEFAAANKIKNIQIIGLGSNLIFSGKIFDGAVIRIADSEKNKLNIAQKDDVIKVYSGVIMDDLIRYSLKNNLIGLEWAGGLPGTAGGGVRGNAGAFGNEIKNYVISAEILERNKDSYAIKKMTCEDLDFSYRNSAVKQNKNMIIISVDIILKSANRKELSAAKKIFGENINYRKIHHPLEYPTCGSVFKNITKPENIKKVLKIWPDAGALIDSNWHGKVPMGYVIKRLGLAKLRIGDMQISSKHSNFIINSGEGKASDVIAIIKKIQNKTFDTFGFMPDIEAEII